MHIQSYIRLIEEELLPNIEMVSESPFDPINVVNKTENWITIGSGNYAGVFAFDNEQQWVVKVYGRNHEEVKKEIDVYKKLGKHKAYSTLYGYGENYLVLKRLEGITLFNAVVKGIPIPESVINDIDEGLEYAKLVGLNPFDVHGKNVIMNGHKGYIVDVSDFYKSGYCSKWKDLKKAYHKVYKRFIYKWHPPIPLFIMDAVRKGYRSYKRFKRGRIKRGQSLPKK